MVMMRAWGKSSDARFLATWREVTPEVEDSTCDAVASEAKENSLGFASFECDSKHGGDDESSMTDDGRGPSAKHGA